MPSKDEKILREALSTLRDSKESLTDYYAIERFKIDFLKRLRKLKSDLRVLTAENEVLKLKEQWTLAEKQKLKVQIEQLSKDLEIRKTCNEESDYYWDTYVFNEEYPFNKENAYKELSDYYFMLEQLPKIYMELSGGMCSYPNYPASSIIQAHNDYVERLTSEYTDRINQLEDILIDIRKNTEDDYVIKKCDEADL